MHNYRISKYNPIFRNEKGHYPQDEWTSSSDIGTIYRGKIFTIFEYMDVEGQYIDAVLTVLRNIKIDTLMVKGLEKRFSISEVKTDLERVGFIFSQEDAEFYQRIKNDMRLNSDDIKKIIKLGLRECMWCELWSKEGTIKIDFGYDYYMHFEGVDIDVDIIHSYQTKGIFIEKQCSNEE